MCEKCSKNFQHVAKISGEMSMQHTIVKALETLPFIWMGDRQTIQLDKREVIAIVRNTFVREDK